MKQNVFVATQLAVAWKKAENVRSIASTLECVSNFPRAFDTRPLHVGGLGSRHFAVLELKYVSRLIEPQRYCSRARRSTSIKY